MTWVSQNRVMISSIALLLVIGATGLLFNQPVSVDSPTAAMHVTIVLKEKGFSPNEVTVRQGGVVTFVTDRSKPFWPASDIHPSHTIYSEFDPRRPLQPDESWDFKFDHIGTWGFHDHIRSYYVGKINVI